MLSMMRAQLYCILKSRSVWALCLIIALFVLATPFALWLYQVWPAFAATGIVELSDEPLPLLQLWGVSIISGSVFAMMICCSLVLIFVEDFNSGYIRNLIQARGGRVSYALSAAVCSVIVAVVVTAAAMLLTVLAYTAQGYPFVMPSMTDALQWMAQVALCSVAYASISVLVAMLTESEAAGVVVALALASGIVENILRLILANIPGVPSFIRDCLDAYLAVDLGQLGQGMICNPMTYVQALVTFAAVVILWLIVMRRKSLA